MKRLTIIAALIACLLAAVGLPPQSARAEGNVRCGQKDIGNGTCKLEANRVGLRNPATLAAGVPVGVVPKSRAGP